MHKAADLAEKLWKKYASNLMIYQGGEILWYQGAWKSTHPPVEIVESRGNAKTLSK